MIKFKKKKLPNIIIILITLFILLSSIYILYNNLLQSKTKNINQNEVPYISTYYIKPVVKPNEEVILDYYITDYYHEEYTKGKYNQKFTATIKIDGKKDIIKRNLKAGDHSISLGKFKNNGEQKFSIMVTDEYNRNSHELFNFFLVQDTPKIHEYQMTKDDLKKYNIKNTDDYGEIKLVNIDTKKQDMKTALTSIANNTPIPSNKYICFVGDSNNDGKRDSMWNETVVKYSDDYNKNKVLSESKSTREGLQKLLNDKNSEGYNKIKLLKGTYRIDHEGTLSVPTKFTLNLNNSTIKLNGFAGNSALMIDMYNTFDSHVINGTIEGDYYEHDYKNSENNSEWVNGVSISAESKYSTYENITIKDITGYGATNGISNGGKSDSYTYSPPVPIGSFKSGDIDRSTGKQITSTDRTISDYIDIKEQSDSSDYLAVNVYLGYQGNPCNTWNIVCSFYDKNKEYIQSTDAYQYRRVKIPKNTKYLRVTLLDNSTPDNLSICYFKRPTHCAFKNLIIDNNRCVGMAQSAMNDMLVENCTFTNSGQSSAKCAYDAEDGWDMMQDVTFRKLKFYNNPNNNFLTCAGHNLTIEDCDMGIYIWGRTRNIVVKNSTIRGGRIHNDGLIRSGVPRFTDNKVTNNLNFINTNKTTYYSIVRDSKFTNTITSATAYNCKFDISEGFLQDVNLYNCHIKNIGVYLNDNIYMQNCIFDSDNKKGSYLRFNQADAKRSFKNCTFKGYTLLCGNYCNSGVFENCSFEDLNIDVNTDNKLGDLKFNNCNITYSDNDEYLSLINVSNNTSLSFNNCSIISTSSSPFSSLVYLVKNPTKGEIQFTDCDISKDTGYVLEGYYPIDSLTKDNKYNILFKDTTINIPASNKYKNFNHYNIKFKN